MKTTKPKTYKPRLNNDKNFYEPAYSSSEHKLEKLYEFTFSKLPIYTHVYGIFDSNRIFEIFDQSSYQLLNHFISSFSKLDEDDDESYLSSDGPTNYNKICEFQHLHSNTLIKIRITNTANRCFIDICTDNISNIDIILSQIEKFRLEESNKHKIGILRKGTH